MVNGCEGDGDGTAALRVLSKVSPVMQCLVQPSNCSPLCRCWLRIAVMHRTVCRPCVPDETRALLVLGKTSCESFGAARRTKVVGFMNTDWISIGLRDPRMVLGTRKCHRHQPPHGGKMGEIPVSTEQSLSKVKRRD